MTFLCELVARCKVHRQINRIKTRIHEISDSRLAYGIENIGIKGEGTISEVCEVRERRRSCRHPFEEDVVGLVENIEILEDQLIHGDSRRSVVSIWFRKDHSC